MGRLAHRRVAHKLTAMGLMQGLSGNAQQIDPQRAQNDYGPWLIQDEQIATAYQLVRDGFCITNWRIIALDRQGATGKKTRVKSINLRSIVDVVAETAGGLDDSEIFLTYITTPRLAAQHVSYDTYRFEFPRSFDVAELYRYFMGLAAHNVAQLNEA